MSFPDIPTVSAQGEHNDDSLHETLTNLDELNDLLQAAVDTLESHRITPNSYTQDSTRIPFGPFADGTLSASVTVDEGFLSGVVSYIPHPDSAKRSFTFRRNIEDRYWLTPSRKFALTNTGLARRLDAN
ncbi:hypothetical protein EOL96_01735 [Candidatus Saccharibacteria bacterium]|nr:hypothetical protein [Candidatus Saccharibacteria bacterium]